jgi:hypothetical protein
VLENYEDRDIHKDAQDFCLKNKIVDDIRKKVIIVIFDAIPQLKTKVIDEEYTKTIIILSKVLTGAIKLEKYTTSLLGNNISFNEAINKLQKEDDLFKDTNIWNDVAKIKKELKEKVTENTKANKKAIEILNADPFYLDYYQIYDTNESDNVYIEVELGYDKKPFIEFDPKRIQETYLISDISNEHFLIILDKLLLNIFNGKINNKNYSQFFINLPNKFLKKKTNLKKLLNMTNINYLKNKISFKITGVQLEEYENEIKQIMESGYTVALGDIAYLGDNMGKIRLFAKYIFVDKDVLLKRMEIIPISEDANITLISLDKVKEAMLIDV